MKLFSNLTTFVKNALCEKDGWPSSTRLSIAWSYAWGVPTMCIALLYHVYKSGLQEGLLYALGGFLVGILFGKGFNKGKETNGTDNSASNEQNAN